MTDPSRLPRLLTPAEVCAILGLSPEQLRGLRKRGAAPPHVRLTRGLVRYPADRLEAWIAAREAPDIPTERTGHTEEPTTKTAS